MNNGERPRTSGTTSFTAPLIRPLIKKRTSVPIYENHIEVGARPEQKVYTVLKVYVHKATFQYPEPAVFIQMANGNGSVYAKLNSPQELKALASLLTKWEKEIEPIFESALKDADSIDYAHQQQFDYQKMVDFLNSPEARQMQALFSQENSEIEYQDTEV